MSVKSREAGGQGYANAIVVFTLKPGGGTIHTSAQITGQAASMCEDGPSAGCAIADFTGKLGTL